MKDRVIEATPGDKGQWYLRMLGLDDGAPATLQEVARSREAQKTSELVIDMLEETSGATGTAAPAELAGWKPEGLSATAASRRRVRWPMLTLALAIAVAATFALWWMPQASNQRASVHAELMEEALSGLYADLADLQQSLATATEPSSATPDLGTIAPGLSGVADSAARLLDVSNEPVPSALPMSPGERFVALDLFRLDLEPLAAEATSIRSEVAAIAEYRLALSNVLATEALPLTADSALVNSQTAALAKVLADSVAALNQMPVDGPFASHRQLVNQEVSGFAQWQEDYLASLRAGDASGAGELVESLRLVKEGISAELVGVLAELRSAVDARILDLADRLSSALVSIPT